MKKGHILIVDDNKNVLSALRIFLSNYFSQVDLLSSPNRLLSVLNEKKPDIILLDMNFSAGINSGNEGLFWLSKIKSVDPNLPVVLFTAYAEIELAVKGLKEGACDFVVKPWDNAKLLATLQSAYDLSQSNKIVNDLKDKQNTQDEGLNETMDICWGESEVMQLLSGLIKKVAQTDANILITGENGTGKGVIARKIHHLSRRNKEKLVSVDMGAITESLFESELFGYMKGAFTDAKTDHAGKFEIADKGTLFLDEIGNLSYPLQAKLLTALQSRQIFRVGSNIPISIDIRLICATNKDIFSAVRNREFREDLLYRINTIQIEVPPLRNHREDIPLLSEFFLHKFSLKYGKELSISSSALEKLKDYSWPGNIRELQHLIEKAVILSDSNVLGIKDFSISTIKNMNDKELFSLEGMEKTLIAKALEKHSGNISAVASELGITRPTLYNKIKKYGLS